MTYKIREAITADLATTWVWRNDPVTRAMARVATPVSPAQYMAWYNSVAQSPYHLLLVAEKDNSLIAYAWFAPFKDPGSVTITLTLGADFRGQGHGAALIPLFTKEAASKLKAREIVAHIRTENAPSHKVFTRAGFEACGVKDGIHRYRLPVFIS